MASCLISWASRNTRIRSRSRSLAIDYLPSLDFMRTTRRVFRREQQIADTLDGGPAQALAPAGMEDPGKITLGSQNHIAIHGAVVTQRQSISIDPHVDPITTQVLRQQINLAFDLLDRVLNRLHVDIAGIGSLELFPFVVILAAAKLPHVVLHFNNEHAILVYYYIVQLHGPSFVLEGDVGQQDVPFLQVLAQQKRRAGLSAFPGKLLRGDPMRGRLGLARQQSSDKGQTSDDGNSEEADEERDRFIGYYHDYSPNSEASRRIANRHHSTMQTRKSMAAV